MADAAASAAASAVAPATAEVERLLGVVEALDPPAAQELRGGLPRCDSTFGLGLAFFLTATGGGGRDWLGPDLCRSLDALDGGALLEDLDVALLPRHRRTADGRSWRVLNVPVLESRSTRSLLCAVADDDLQTGNAFVLQMRLPQLGAVQLVAAGEGKRFDVTLQTADGLSSALLADIQEDFAAAMADAGLRGDLTIGPLVGSWLDLDEGLSADAVV